MPEDRRNSQPLQQPRVPRRIFGSLPNLLESAIDKDQTGKLNRRPKWMKHQKKLSQGEEKILESLHKMYEEIDPEKPDDMLTSEQAVVKKLKILYETEGTAYKPVAPRKKQELAISKPLLESVYSNPKLESIAKNPNLKNLETDRFSWMGHKRFADEQEGNSKELHSRGFVSYVLDTPEVSPFHDDQTKDVNTRRRNTEGFQSYLSDTPEVSPRTSDSRHHRASSIGTAREFRLRRYSSKEDLTGLNELNSFKRISDMAMGKRSSLKSFQSDTSSNISQKKRVSFDEKRNSIAVIKEFYSLESLEDIYKSIDPNVPEEQLTKEQRFALRLKASTENLGQKPALRKRPTLKRSKVTISSPLRESVLKNTKLLSIIKDPVVRAAGEDSEQEIVELRKIHRMKKYLAGVNKVVRHPSKTMCKNDSRLSRSLEDIRFYPIFDRISSSMENLPSEGHVNTQTEIRVITKVLPEQSFATTLNVSSGSSSVENSIENLEGEKEETPVVFIEHFEPETTSAVLNKMENDDCLQIEDITEDFDKFEVCRLRLLSINSVEMDEEDDVLARYKRISEYKEDISDKESYQEHHKEEDVHSFYSVELKVEEDVPEDNSSIEEENWLTKLLDQSCDIEDKKENRKMRFLYKDVVQEIKRKYSHDQQSPNESSDEETSNIFNAKDDDLEVHQLEDQEDDEDFFDRFFKPKRSLILQSDHQKLEGVAKCHSDDPEKSCQEEYIKNVREMFKEEFEDIDRLGHTEAESDNFKKILLRQDAISDDSSSRKMNTPEMSNIKNQNLSHNDLKLMSSVKRRHSRPLSEINQDDIAFIESMKEKYLKDEENNNCPNVTYHSSLYLKYITENFLLEEIESYRNSCDEKIFSSGIDVNLKHSTEMFLMKERQDGVENRKFPMFEPKVNPELIETYQTNSEQNDDYLQQPEKQDDISKLSDATCTNSSDFDLRYLTANFLDEEINYNTYFVCCNNTRYSNDTRNSPNYISKTEILLDDDWNIQNITQCSTSEKRVSTVIDANNMEQGEEEEELDPSLRMNSTKGYDSNSKNFMNSTASTSWTFQYPIYQNFQEIQPQNVETPRAPPRKPKPLPRKHFRELRSDITGDSFVTVKFDDSKVKNEVLEGHVPNSSKVMDEPYDAVITNQVTNLGEHSKDFVTKSMDTVGSSNVMVRKTKKFVKDGNVVEEFDEASGVCNVHLDSVAEEDKFGYKNQVIPESFIGYCDSESKITLFDVENFQEACSRPQTSRQRSTPFRLSYYGESSEEVAEGSIDRTSKENVTRLKQKFEHLSAANDESERNSTDMQESEEAQKANLTKLINEKTAYDLVFKTESKFWFDNASEIERPECSLKTSEPCFDSASLEKPLNITILDPIESKTNANYQHLFENEGTNRTLQKPFGGNVKLSELNLKTSIPCVDFTTLNTALVERGSNASLFNFGVASDGSTAVDGAACAARDE